MSRYVGDLTDPKNSEEREKVARMVEMVVIAVRNREVRRLEIVRDEEVSRSWTVGIGIDVTHRGRHEK